MDRPTARAEVRLPYSLAEDDLREAVRRLARARFRLGDVPDVGSVPVA